MDNIDDGAVIKFQFQWCFFLAEQNLCFASPNPAGKIKSMTI